MIYKIKKANFRSYLAQDSSKFTALALFLFLVLILGGASRDDVQSLVILRPISILFIAYALSVAKKEQIVSLGAPLLMLMGLLALMVVQLIPIPPDIWSSLPHRQAYLQVLEAAGTDQLWRPLSLSPSKTLNSLFALAVPIAAICLFGIQDRKAYSRLTLLLTGMALATTVWGLLQLTASPYGPLYTYRITNNGLPVGFFANRNHQAVVLAGLLPTLTLLGGRLLIVKAGSKGNLQGVVALFALLLAIPTILMTGSRAGFIAMLMGLAASVVVLLALWKRSDGQGNRWPVSPRYLGGAALVIVSGLVTLWFGRALAISRLGAHSVAEELRLQVLPTLWKLTIEFQPVGSGFGSFEHVYTLEEPTSLLRREYFNNAHNDWLQVAMEGGVFAVGILVVFMAWVVRQALVTYRARNIESSIVALRVAALAFLAALAVASLFDYPLRVPSIMALLAIFSALLVRTERPSPRT